LRFRLTILAAICLLPLSAAAQGITFGKTVDTPQGRYAQRRLMDAAPPPPGAGVGVRLDQSIESAVGAEA
jgi:hypothetical protein